MTEEFERKLKKIREKTAVKIATTPTIAMCKGEISCPNNLE
jgi:hypothetical protein